MRSLSLVILCLALFLVFSCATRRSSDDFWEDELIVEEEPFEEEEIVEEEIILEEPLVEEIIVEEIEPEPEVVSHPMEAVETLGFRVQIHAFLSKAGADAAAGKARLLFPERVYVEYIAPYHKVRVGDCVTRSEVETLKARAKQLGYTDAFTVETMIKP